MTHDTRRDFHRKLLGSVTAYALIETLYHRDLFADAVRPVIHQWMIDMNALCKDVKEQKIKDVDFQAKLEDLYKKADLPELIKLLDLDKVAGRAKLPDNGAASIGLDLSKVEGVGRIVFGKQIFGLKKGRSIVPHGHDNMCTGFIVLRGDFHGRHYDRVEDNKDHYLIKPTIDRTFKVGECSTISDHKDNVHWFKAASDAAYIFNVHVIAYDKDVKDVSSRLYLDPDGETLEGGLIKAAKMTSEACHKKYG